MDEPSSELTTPALPHRPGDVIVVRTVTDGRIRWASPAIAVEDSDEWIAYYLPNAARNKVTAGTRVTSSLRDRELALRAELLAGEWSLVDHIPVSAPSLVMTRPGDPFSVRLRAEPEKGDFIPTYINIERAHARTTIGFDADDLCLDVLIAPDGSWSLKDSDDLNERVVAGIYTEQDAAGVRAAATQAIARLESRLPPFDGSWSGWRPSPTWPFAQLRADWAAFD